MQVFARPGAERQARADGELELELELELHGSERRGESPVMGETMMGEIIELHQPELPAAAVLHICTRLIALLL